LIHRHELELTDKLGEPDQFSIREVDVEVGILLEVCSERRASVDRELQHTEATLLDPLQQFDLARVVRKSQAWTTTGVAVNSGARLFWRNWTACSWSESPRR
jgi:hypothetical protein